MSLIGGWTWPWKAPAQLCVHQVYTKVVHTGSPMAAVVYNECRDQLMERRGGVGALLEGFVCHLEGVAGRAPLIRLLDGLLLKTWGWTGGITWAGRTQVILGGCRRSGHHWVACVGKE